MRSLHRTVAGGLGLALLMSLIGCATQPSTRGPQPSQHSDRQAVELLHADKPEAAAREYLRLADLTAPPERYTYALHAAAAYIEAGDAASARQILGRVQIVEPDPFLSAWHSVLLARLDLERNPKPLLEKLERLDPAAVPPDFLARYHEYLAAAYLGVGEYLKAAGEYVALYPLLGNEAQRNANALATWDALGQLEVTQLSQHLPPDRGPLRGWMDLAIIARSQAHDGTPFEARVRDWKLLYPGHPAAATIVPQLAERRAALEVEPQHVALLLPLTGEYSAASAAVRDGFLAAWYQDPGHYRRRVLTVYDANQANAVAVYRRALQEGADFIVGPLDKPALRALVRGNVISVPTLALNEIDNPSGGSSESAPTSEQMLFQFGLSPEDEARQIAERGWLDGRVQARVIVPQSPWGGRVARAFEDHWKGLGGEVVARVNYPRNALDLKGAVGRLLAGSVYRDSRSYTSSAIGADAEGPAAATEFVFMATNPRDARLIQPLIAYHGGGRIPIYSTSHAYSGKVSRASDRDLEGLMFPDMPWVLDTERDLLRYEVERQWPRAQRGYVRFYAFGADACTLVTHLGRLSRDPFARLEGATGVLHMESGGAIRRQLTWARFSDGAPVALDH